MPKQIDIPAGWEIVPDAAPATDGTATSVAAAPEPIGIPEGWKELTGVEASHPEISSGRVAGLRKYARQVGGKAFLGAGGLAAARDVPPEERAAFEQLFHEQLKQTRPAKDLGPAERMAMSTFSGMEALGENIADWVGVDTDLDDDQMLFRARLEAIKGGLDPLIDQDAPWYEKGPLQAAQQVPTMVASLAAGGGLGRAAGALGATGKALWAAQATGVGATYYNQIHDDTYVELLKEGMDPETAERTAAVSAILQGVVEGGVVTNPFAKRMGSAAVSKTIRGIVASHMLRFGGEVGEEGLQAIVDETAKEFARRSTGGNKKNAADVAAAGLEAMQESLPALVFLMGPGMVAGGTAEALDLRERAGQQRQLESQQEEAADRLVELEDVTQKGYVSQQDGEEYLIPGGTRKERMDAAQDEIAAIVDDMQERAATELETPEAGPVSEDVLPEQEPKREAQADATELQDEVQEPKPEAQQPEVQRPEGQVEQQEKVPVKVDEGTGDTVTPTPVQGDKPAVDREAIREQFREQMAKKRGKKKPAPLVETPAETGQQTPGDIREQKPEPVGEQVPEAQIVKAFKELDDKRGHFFQVADGEIEGDIDAIESELGQAEDELLSLGEGVLSVDELDELNNAGRLTPETVRELINSKKAEQTEQDKQAAGIATGKAEAEKKKQEGKQREQDEQRQRISDLERKPDQKSTLDRERVARADRMRELKESDSSEFRKHSTAASEKRYIEDNYTVELERKPTGRQGSNIVRVGRKNTDVPEVFLAGSTMKEARASIIREADPAVVASYSKRALPESPRKPASALEAKTRTEKSRERVNKAGDAIKKAAKEQGDTLGLNPADPKWIGLVVEYASAQVELGVNKFRDFVDAFRAEHGDELTRKLDAVLEEGWGTLPEFDIDVDEAGSVEAILAEADKVIPPEGKGDDLTSIKNEVVNELRGKRGVDPLPEAPAETFEEWVDAAADRIAETNGTIGPSLVAEINKDHRPLTNVETAILHLYYRSVNNAFSSAAAELDDSVKSGDPVATAVAMSHTDSLLAELATIEDATKASGTSAGRSLVARKIMLHQDFSVAAMASRARVANAGQPLTAKETSEISEMSKRIESLQEKLKESEAKREDLERGRRVDAEIAKTKRKAVLKKSTRRQKAQAKVDTAWKEFSDLAKGKLYSNPLELAIPAVKVTAAYVELGVVSFSELMAEVGKKIGRENAAKAEDVFRTAWDDMKAKGDIATPEIDQANTGAVSRLAKKIERTVVESGMTEREDVVDAVHDALAEILPEPITRRETMDAMSGYGQFSPLSKGEVDQTIRDINGQLQQLGKLDDMQKGKAPAKTGPERRKPTDEERRLIQQVNEAKKRGGFTTTNAYEENLKRRLAEYQQRISDGDFEVKPKRGPRELSREELNLKLKLEDVKEEFFNKVAEYRISKLAGLDRGVDYARETAHLSRAAMTSFDLSATFRQGGAFVFGHPVMGLKAGHKMIQALVSRQAEFDSIEEIRNRPNGQLYETANLAITEQEGKVTRQEEAFMGRWGKKFGPIRASARAYTTFLNNARADMFDSLVENLGRSGAVTLDESKVIAQFVNAATGRADLGKFNSAAANMNTVFFAPRYVASRFQYLATPFTLPFMKTSGRVKKAIATEYARHAIGLATFMGLVVTLGSLVADDDDDKPTVEFDPRSSDFGKIKIGDTRIDPMSGLSQVVVFGSRMATGERKTSRGEIRALRGEDRKFADDTTTSVLGRFLRSKLAPVPGSAVDLIQGENVVGEESPPAGVALDLFTPLSFREVKDTMVSRGIPEGTAISVLALLGMGTATYGPRTDYLTGNEAEREEQFGKFLKTMKWDTPDPDYQDLLSSEQRQEVERTRDLRRGKVVYAATAEPDRDSHESDETFKKAVERYEKTRGELQGMMDEGVSHEDAQKLLLDRYKGDKTGNQYWGKFEALAKLYGVDKGTARDELLGKRSRSGRRSDVTEFEQWAKQQKDRWRQERKKK